MNRTIWLNVVQVDTPTEIEVTLSYHNATYCILTWENSLEQNPDARQAMLPSEHILDHNNEEHDYYASGVDLGVQTPSWGHSPLQASDSRRHYCVNVSLEQKKIQIIHIFKKVNLLRNLPISLQSDKKSLYVEILS